MKRLHRSHDVEGNALCDLGSTQIFLVNAASNFAGA